ncbi:hypothetical protein CPX_001283 [Candidatus Phytoplasma pruni]|uniref:Uncharacterized protein n=1 Tax=Candidatus Phytoplasma pruni TaxID=479893 RepID=A0A0M1N0N5_9MOLU|nr:hypothetical protein [Candidatus Phytoplasma pruni]KOR75723.1 hypothetical protein CPX_001283 [Candidatus Phytoplasma pruni]
MEQSSEDTSIFDNLIKELDEIQTKQEELVSKEIIPIIYKNKQRLAELKIKAEPILKKLKAIKINLLVSFSPILDNDL